MRGETVDKKIDGIAFEREGARLLVTHYAQGEVGIVADKPDGSIIPFRLNAKQTERLLDYLGAEAVCAVREQQQCTCGHSRKAHQTTVVVSPCDDAVDKIVVHCGGGKFKRCPCTRFQLVTPESDE